MYKVSNGKVGANHKIVKPLENKKYSTNGYNHRVNSDIEGEQTLNYLINTGNLDEDIEMSIRSIRKARFKVPQHTNDKGRNHFAAAQKRNNYLSSASN